MTVEEFCRLVGAQSATVEKWFEKGLLPGAARDGQTGQLVLAPGTLRPYRARAKEARAIYASIVRACSKQQGICPQTYGLPPARFQAYLAQLTEAGLIQPVQVPGGCQQYIQTPKGDEFLQMSRQKQRQWLTQLLQAFAEGAAKGATQGWSAPG